MNAYIQRSMMTHLKILNDKFTDLSAPPNILVARSDGGLMGSERAQRSPIFAALSSSACAARAAHGIVSSAAPGDALALDWGGSTTEITLLHQTPRPPLRDGSVGPYRLGLPTLGTRHIGAGAGSLVDIPITGMIRIKTPAANGPGPACYGLGGTVATLTDANVILGRLPLGLLGGRFPIDTGAAETAMSPVAKALGMDLVEAAKAVIDVANEEVYGNICLLASEKHLEAKHLTLIAFGGAGPMHANALGMLGNMFPVVIPPQPGMLSAHGALTASQRHELSQTILKPIATMSSTLLDQVLQKLQTHVNAQLQDDGSAKDKYTFLAEADLRYSGDSVEITLPLHLADPSANLDKLEAQFVSAHQTLSGFDRELPVEIVNLRIIGYTQPQVSTLKAKSQLRRSESTIPDQCRICFDGDFLDTQVYERLDLTPDMSVSGPAVILQYDATTLIHPGHNATVCPDGTLLIRPQTVQSV
jgi:N-methylhydantoinase A